MTDAFSAITGSMPDVQSGAVAAANADAEAAKDAEAPYGRKADGTPRKSPGRKKGSTNSTVSGANVASGSTVSPETNPAYQAGIQIGQTILTTAALIGGPAFVPVEDIIEQLPKEEREKIPPGLKERPQFLQAYGNWAVRRGITEVPPYLELLVANVAFFGPRLAQPKTRGWIAKRLGDLKIRVFAWWERRKGAKEEREKKQ